MLRPIAVQIALKHLLESEDVPADTALVVFSDSGSIYSQAHAEASSSKSTPNLRRSVGKTTESQKLQLSRQPGLKTLLGTQNAPFSNSVDEEVEEKISTSEAIALSMSTDERSKIIGAIACQGWIEETNRVRRLFTKIHGHTPGPISDSSAMMRSFSGSTSGGTGSGNGVNGKSRLKRIEQNGLSRIEGSVNGSEILDGHDEEIEMVAAPVAVPGTFFQTEENTQSVAPLLLEGEMGAMLVLPLHHKVITSTPPSPLLQSSPPLLLVLATRPQFTQGGRGMRQSAASGESILSQQDWKNLHDAANAFASHIGPAMRKVFTREAGGSPGAREANGDAVTETDMESSAADFDGLAITSQETSSQGVMAGIPVR